MGQKCLPFLADPGQTPHPHHHVALWLRATVEMRLRRVYAQGGVWRYGGRMVVFATTQGLCDGSGENERTVRERCRFPSVVW